MHILMLAKTTLNRQAIRQAKESTQERLEREHDPCETYEAVVDQGSAEKEKKKSCVAPFFISSLKSQRQHAIVFFLRCLIALALNVFLHTKLPLSGLLFLFDFVRRVRNPNHT